MVERLNQKVKANDQGNTLAIKLLDPSYIGGTYEIIPCIIGGVAANLCNVTKQIV